jgi:hypothetical protein
MAGEFVVDPATIGGSCNFVLSGGAEAEGVVSLFLLSTAGVSYGTFLGNVTGIGFSAVNGTGTLTVLSPN